MLKKTQSLENLFRLEEILLGWNPVDRVIDFGLGDHEIILLEIAKKLADATGSAFEDIQRLLDEYLKSDWRIITALAGASKDSLAGLFVATPLTEEAFVSIMSGRYLFPHQGNGVYLPHEKDVLPYSKSGALLIAALGFADPSDRDITRMLFQVRGSFLMQFAWKRMFDIACVTGKGEDLDRNIKEIMFPSPTVFEDHQGYRTHMTSFGPIREQKDRNRH